MSAIPRTVCAFAFVLLFAFPTAGHALAGTSILQRARVTDAPRRMTLCNSSLALSRSVTSLTLTSISSRSRV